METSNGQLDLIGLSKQRGLRKPPRDLGVPNPYLVLEAMATYEISKGECSSEERKDLEQNSEEQQH